MKQRVRSVEQVLESRSMERRPKSRERRVVPAAVWHGARHVHGNRATERWSDEAIG